jgi:hypothetical protein
VAHDRTFPSFRTTARARLTVLVHPEIASEGDTEAEALAMAEDGIRLVLEDRAARREHVPGDSPPASAR